MRILLFGAGGYIGSEFVKQLQGSKDIQLTILHSRLPNGDHYTYKYLEQLISYVNPYAIINCAAYTGGISILGCEKNKEETIKSNVIFPQMLAEICESQNIILGHMSSACLYNGYPQFGYHELDTKMLTFENGCSFYTGTKSMAEDCISAVNPQSYIWRVRLPFDEYDAPRNYLSKIMSFDTLVDARNSLSNRRELVSACIKCLTMGVPFGIYHVTNTGAISSSDIVLMMRDLLKINKDYRSISTKKFDESRGFHTSNALLSNAKLKSVGIRMSGVYESVEFSLKNWKTSLK